MRRFLLAFAALVGLLSSAYAVSLGGTVIGSGSGSITDNSAGVWTIAGGVVKLNGGNVAGTTTATTLLWYNSTIYKYNGNWSSWNGSAWSANLPADPRLTLFNPTDPVAAGYLLVEDEEFGAGSLPAAGAANSHVSFATAANAVNGSNFYTSNLQVCGIAPASEFSIAADGSLQDAGRTGSCGANMFTSGYAPGKTNVAGQANLVGKTFYPSYYTEVNVKFHAGNNAAVSATWWHQPANFMTGSLQHYIEEDDLEYVGVASTLWYNNLHDWYTLNGHVPPSAGSGDAGILYNFSMPGGKAAFGSYHKYGTLITYGGPVGSCGVGFKQNYLDGVAVGVIHTWTDCLPLSTYPQSGTNIDSGIDQQLMMGIFGTTPGDTLNIKTYKVWQSPASAGASGNGPLGPPAPTAALTATPATINPGASSILTWSTTNATSCTGTGFSTGGAITGTAVVSPTASTTYTINCTGAGGSVADDATVRVITPVKVNSQFWNPFDRRIFR